MHEHKPHSGRCRGVGVQSAMFFKNQFKVKDRSYFDALTVAGSMGLHMVTHTLVGGVAGYYLDEWLGTKPWLLLTFLIFGIVAGFRSVFQDTKRLSRKQAKSDAEKFDSKD